MSGYRRYSEGWDYPAEWILHRKAFAVVTGAQFQRTMVKVTTVWALRAHWSCYEEDKHEVTFQRLISQPEKRGAYFRWCCHDDDDDDDKLRAARSKLRMRGGNVPRENSAGLDVHSKLFPFRDVFPPSLVSFKESNLKAREMKDNSRVWMKGGRCNDEAAPPQTRGGEEESAARVAWWDESQGWCGYHKSEREGLREDSETCYDVWRW